MRKDPNHINPQLQDITPIIRLIRERSGLTIGTDHQRGFAEMVQDAMAAAGATDVNAFCRRLSTDTAAFRTFLNRLTINETYFFREPAHYDLLIRRILPALIAAKGETEDIGILSAGCATGEEAYTIAMVLTERYESPFSEKRFRIHGVDIDTDAIRKAEAGVFGPRSFRVLDRRYIDRYFTETGGGRYAIAEDLRRAVRFHTCNLLETPYPQVLSNMDIIWYRNVSIYFDPEIQKRIFENLARILNTPGYIFVSSTETLSNDFRLLQLVEMDGVFLFYKEPPGLEIVSAPPPRPALSPVKTGRRATDAPSAKTQRPHPVSRQKSEPAAEPNAKKDTNVNRPPATASSPPEPGEMQNRLYQEALSLAETKQYEAALSALDRLFTLNKQFPPAQTLMASILINQKRFDEAQTLCLSAVETDPLCHEAYFFLGMIARFQTRYEEAIRRFKEALYAKAASWPAAFYLAETYLQTGKIEHAHRAYNNAIRLIEKGLFFRHGIAYFPLYVSESQILALCRNKQAKTRGQSG
jgi:chemotaxis protein methyltransferase CheR